MDNLLRLAHLEKADELRLKVGKPPVMVWRDNYPKFPDGKHRTIEGPAVTIGDCDQFLQFLTNSRQRRDIRERGGATFFYQFDGQILFLVRARIKDEVVELEIQ